jgi:hypothetical protein
MRLNEKKLFGFDLRLVLLFIPVAYLSYLFHEFGHWSIGELLGNDMDYSLNWVWPKSGQYINPGHGWIVSLGGPAYSILQALIALVVIGKFRTCFAYPFLFFPFFSRFFSLAFGGFAKQDEARISASLGAGTYTVAIIVLLILILLVWRGSKKLGYGFREITFFYIFSTVGSLMVIGTYTLNDYLF